MPQRVHLLLLQVRKVLRNEDLEETESVVPPTPRRLDLDTSGSADAGAAGAAAAASAGSAADETGDEQLLDIPDNCPSCAKEMSLEDSDFNVDAKGMAFCAHCAARINRGEAAA
jgi:hypothetical protein